MIWLHHFVLLMAVAGHLGLTFLLINITHGSGWLSRWLNRLTWAGLAASFLGSLACVVLLWGRPFSTWPFSLQLYGAACLATSLVGVPAASVLRALRRHPAGVTVRSRVLDFSRIPGNEAPPIGTGLRALMLRLPGNEALRVRTLDITVELDGLPPALDGLSILHLSDFHFTHAFRRTFFEAVTREASRFEADLVLFTGDLLDEPGCAEWIEPVLGQLRGRLGTYAILGNHDHLAGPARVIDGLARAGFEVLEGRWSPLRLDGATLAVGGTSAPWGPDLNPSERPRADLSILLCHTPDRLYLVKSWGIDLMFSGHNHGGQVRLPLIGPILMPSRYSRRFDAGFFRSGQTLLYVSRGLGAEFPLRFGSIPEIARLTFRVPSRRPEGSAPVRSATDALARQEIEARGLASAG